MTVVGGSTQNFVKSLRGFPKHKTIDKEESIVYN